MKEYSLIDLLPYKEDKKIISSKEEAVVLRIIMFLCSAAIDAIEVFQKKKYSYFDAQVSESLCQIRAYQLIQYAKCDLHHHKILFSPTTSIIKEVYVRANNMLLKKENSREQDRKILLLTNFLRENKLFCVLQEVEYFLIHTYILSKYKLIGEYETSHGINYSFLCYKLGVYSNTLAKRVIHNMQRNLSKLSCEFIYSLMSIMKYKKKQFSLINNLHLTDEIGRQLISCYEVTKIILEHAYSMKEIVKIKVIQVSTRGLNTIEFFLCLFTGGIYFIPKEEYNSLCFIGVTRLEDECEESRDEYISRFLKIGFKEIILANMAQHPQFSGLLLSDRKENPYTEVFEKDRQFNLYKRSVERNFIKHKVLASQIGCAPQNPGLFLLTHIRCEDLDLNDGMSLVKKQDRYDFAI